MGGDDVGDEPEGAGRLLLDEHGGLSHARARGERCLDLAELHAEAADLDLAVDAAEEEQRPVGPVAGAVAGAVEPRARRGGEGILDEALGGELGAAQVAPRDAGAAQIDLARHARGRGRHLRVEHVDAGVGERAAERHGGRHGGQVGRAPAALEGVGEHAHRGLGRAVVVEDAAVGREPLDAVDELVAASLAAEHEEPPRDHLVGAGRGEQRREVRGDDLEAVDAFALEIGGERVGIGGDLGGQDVEAAAAGERREEHGVAEVGREGGDVRVGRAPRQIEAGGHAAHVVDDLAVLDRHALGHARGTGGEEHVGEVGGGGLERGAGVALGGERAGVGVEAHQGHGRESVGQGRVGDDDGGAGLAEDLREARRGVRGIERQVRAAGLEDAEERDHEIRAALAAEAHHRVGDHAQAAQVVGEPVGAHVELAVREALGAGHQRGLAGRLVDLRLEELVDALARRERGVRVVPAGEQEAPLVVGEHGQLAEAPLRILHHGAEQRLELADQAVDGGRVEEIGGVLEAPDDPAGVVGHDEGEVDLDRGAVGGEARELHAREAQALAGRVLEVEDHLEERRAAGIRLRLELLHQALEGHVLVGVGAERDLLDPAEELLERQIRRDLRAHDQRVEEEADHPLGLGARAPGDGGADDEVVLAAVAVEQHVERREEHHVERGALAPGQLLDAGGELRREGEGALPTARRRQATGRGRSVGSSRAGGAPASCAFQ